MLTKSLLPLPDKFKGLTDVEMRYRQRYVDLIANPEVRDTFRARAGIVSGIRRFLDDRAFMEMETPVLESRAGGADAKRRWRRWRARTAAAPPPRCRAIPTCRSRLWS